MNQSQRDLRTFMAIAQEQAIAEAKLMPTTPDIKRRAHVLAEFARDRLAHMQREPRARRPSNVVSGAIRNEYRARYPTMQFAHRDYEHMPENDLRSALEDVRSLIERGV